MRQLLSDNCCSRHIEIVAASRSYVECTAKTFAKCKSQIELKHILGRCIEHMTYQEALKAEKRWNKRALIISMYHYKMLLKNKKWTQRMSAKRLLISLGAVSEALMLSRAFHEQPGLENLTREEALSYLRAHE